MPRPCLICSSKARLKKAAELIAAGCPDQAIANALNRLGHRTRARGAAERTTAPPPRLGVAVERDTTGRAADGAGSGRLCSYTGSVA